MSFSSKRCKMFHGDVQAGRLKAALVLLTFLTSEVCGQEGVAPSRVLVVPLEDQIIQPVTVRFLTRAIRQGADLGYQCVIIQLDTPGGLLSSTRYLVKEMLVTDVPVVVYVAPSGGRAGSAGVFITLAAHKSAMAPGTTIGAAQPMALGGNGELAKNLDRQQVQDIMAEKVTNDAAAWAQALAEFRGRDVEWAAKAVRESSSIPAKEAAEKHIVDFVANDLNDLLSKLDGHEVTLNQHRVILHTKDAVIERIELSWPEKMLSLLANPTLAYLLLLLGISGLMFEITHPGSWIPGIVGMTCLVLAFVAMQLLPINYAGLAMLLLGLLLVVLEVKVHSYGILTVAGLVSLVIGSAMLIEPIGGVERVSWVVVAPMSISVALIMLLLVSNVVRAHRGKGQTGMESLVGGIARVHGNMDGLGYVFIAGELWRAKCETPLQDGENVRILGYEGLTLFVRPAV